MLSIIKKLFATLLLTFASLLSFTSCEVGLGESVDTSAPNIEISYPPASAVIKGTFTLSGSWTDDKTISSVKISVMDTSSQETVLSGLSATINTNGSWSINMNEYNSENEAYYNGWQIADGTYQISATAYDSAGHKSSTVSRTFDIDNTAPIFVISSPGVTLSSGNFKQYGSTLKVSGTIADSHSIAAANLQVYDEDGNTYLADGNSFTIDDVETTGGANITFARYIKNGTSQLTANYNSIYADSIDKDSGTKKFSGSITIRDNAKLYTNPDEQTNSTEGNSTSVVYLYDDVYSSLMSATGSGLGLEVAQFINVLNGTSTLDSVVQETVRNTLSEKGKDTASSKENYLAFSLNPNAVPTYAIASMNVNGLTTDGFGSQTAAKGTSVTATVSLSTNNTNLAPSTFKAWIYPLGDKPENITETSLNSKIAELNNAVSDSSLSSKQIKTNTGWTIIADNSEYSSGSVNEQYSYSFTISEAVTASYYYIIALTGEDVDGANLTASSGYYGFIGGAGLPPTIREFKITDSTTNASISSNGFVSSSDNVSYSLDASGSSELSKATFELTVSDTANSNAQVGTASKTVDFTEFETDEDGETDKTSGSISLTLNDIIDSNAELKAIASSGKYYSYAVKVTVYDIAGNNANSTQTVYVDAAKPSITISSVSPTVIDYSESGAVSKVSLNGLVSISGTVIEDNLNSVKLTLQYSTDGGSTFTDVPGSETSLGTGRSISTKISTLGYYQNSSYTEFASDTKLRIKIVAKDVVGNSAEYLSTTYNIDSDNANGLDFVIDQSTDKPVITLSQGDVSATSLSALPDENYFTTSSVLKPTITDDDGLSEISVTITDTKGNELANFSTSGNTKTSRTISYPLSNITEGEGIYGVTINAKDSQYDSAEDSLSISDSAKATLGTARVTELTQKVQGYRTASSGTFYIAIDDAAPKVTETASNSGKNTIEISGGAVTLSGTVVETNKIESFVIGEAPLSLTTVDATDKDGKYWLTDSSTGTYAWSKTYNITADDFAENSGTKTYSIVVTDLVGKTGSLSVTIGDTKQPVITEEGVGANGTTVNTSSPTFTLSGTITEINGLSAVTISADNLSATLTKSETEADGSYWPTSTATGTAGTYSWKKTFVAGSANSSDANFINDGSYSITITAKDTVGNAGSVTRAVLVDTVAPTLSPKSGETYITTASSTTDDETWFNTNSLTFEGTASDTQSYSSAGISKVEYSLSTVDSSTKKVTWSEWAVMTGTTSWSKTISSLVSETVKTTDETISCGSTIKIRVTDNAGNTTESGELGPWKFDLDSPTVDTTSVYTKFGSADESSFAISTEVQSNKKDSIVAKFPVTDPITTEGSGSSGIKKVYVSTSKTLATSLNNGFEATKLSDNYYSVEIPKDSITAGTVYAHVYDNVDNYGREQLFTISVDETAPTVVLNTPTDADSTTSETTDVNKKISFSGTATDNVKLDKVTKIYYSATKPSSADKIDTANSLEITSADSYYSWTAEEFDTTTLTDKTTYYFVAVAQDDAGNTGYSDIVSLYVNQDSDRPQVKINNLTANGSSYILKYGTKAQVTGTITDDDSASTAVISKLIISETEYTGTGDEPTNLVSFTASTGDFTFTPSNTEDGTKTFYIYIEDNAGGKFYTTATAENNLENPKISVKGTAAAESVNSSTFTYSSDGTNPVVNLGEGLPYASTTGSVAKDDSGNDFALTTADKQTTNATLNSSFKVGGTSRRYVKFYFTASDASGVAGMTVVFKNESGDVLKRLATALTIGDVTLSGDDYSVSGSFTATTDSTAAAWTTGFIDLSTFGTGQISVAVTPYDNAGLSGNGAFSFNVDNTAPTIEVRSPSSGTEVTGSVSISGTANDTGAAGTSNIQWIVPTTTQTTTFNAKTSDADKLAYLQGLSWNGGEKSLADGATLISWQFDFDGQYDTATSDSDNFVFSAGNPLFNVYDKTDFATNSDYSSTGLYYLPVYFLATDALGNASYSTGFYIKHNPDADRPKLEFTYPTKDNYKSDTEQYAVLGGTIRATGSAEIPSGTTTVGAIYYQIADEDGAFDSDDMAQATTYGYTVVRAWDAINAVKGTSFTSSTTLTDAQLNDFGFASNEAFQAWWGVKANGTASWNLVLNSSGELNPSDDSSTTNITLRACGINADGKVGAWTSGDNVIAIHVDNTAPVISGVVNQYSNGTAALTAVPTTEYTSSQTYEADMYLRGYWTLVATVVDETEVKTYSVLKGSTALTAGSGYFVESGITDSSTGKNGYRLYIPIPKDSGSVEITINASDNEHDSSLTYSFNIDETAPTLEKLTGNGTSFDSADFESIEDDNYQFILAGSSTDEGSGVENILFYYMRKNEPTRTITDEVVMDPMITSSTDDAKVAMSDLTERTFAQESDKFTLYAKAYTGTATTETFTSDSAYDAHVRIGGVVEIDGILHTISAISGNTVTFSPSLSAAKTSFTAYFPIAQVIDNSATEKVKSYSANPFTFEKGDDGDKMPESFSKSGKTWTWDATIHSTNMPDGPASLVILAFDSAGNVAGKTINTKITNNAPRLAKVFLGTDLSGDGKYVNSSSLTEIVEYDILGAEGATQKAYTLDFTEKQNDGTTAKYSAGTFKIKNGLAVIPELTGGNGDIGMVLKTGATSATAVTGTVTNATSSSSESADSDGNISASFTGTVAGEFKGSNASYKMHAFTVAKDGLGSDGTNKGMSFTFWDSTEETTQGTDSQYSVLYVKNFTVAQSDSTKPTVVVNPFYWNASDDNSLYGNSSDNGHIELEGDLTDSIKTAYGSDPKVSGKITFTGTAYDEHKLSSLEVQFGTFLDTATSVATYDSANSSWTVASKTMDSDGYEFTVKDATSSDVGNYSDSVYFDQKGHKVCWTLSIDTSKITTVAATDVKVTVTATDASSNATDTSSITAPVTTSGYVVTDGTTNYPVYQMDVVPYVNGIKTSLSSLKKTNSSIYDRTALGHYAVDSTETIYVYGFNLTGGSLYDSASTPNTAALTKVSDITSLKWYSANAIPAGSVYSVASISAFTSGKVSVKVNSIESLNNLNSNDSKGSYTGTTTSTTGSSSVFANYYNRQPNGDSNNLLTDDVMLDVWEFNSEAAVPKGTGRLNEPVMKISPKNGMIHFAFADGPLFFAMGGGYYGSNSTSDHTSYDYWVGGFDFFSSVGFAVDDIGHTYGVTAGGDINSTTADSFSLYTSRWGIGGRNDNGSRSYGHRLPVEVVAQKDSNNQIVFDKYRFNNSPSLATVAHGTELNSSTSVYLAYYDNINDEIRFRCGTTSDVSDGTAGANNSSQTAFGTFANVGSSTPQTYNATSTLIAGRTTGYDTGYNAGSYVSIAPVKTTTSAYTDDVLVIVWYDQTNSRMMYAYSANPIGNCAAGEYTPGASNNGWDGYEEVFSDGIGQYCKVAVDANGGIHVAAYDASNGDLWYAYKSSYNGGSWQKYIVDSSGIVGSEITLDVALDSDGNAIPYIGYYATSIVRPKYAWLAKPASLAAGAEDDVYTGVWETTIVPTSSTVPADNINVGVWKTSAGVRTTSISETWVKNNTNYNDSNATNPDGKATNGGNSWGYAWANATDNPMMAYQVGAGSSGTLETAQMK
ncbi:beta strand repeat-containing protein [Treponema zioleckii]|uniref:beta strand repeat-containing protein n=1 Tax=Treponema zioleckii TaxID=331680 RepID=UPI00168BC4D3|nr:Ig-like domain-containing protein [Treponema zioleckii]